MKSKIQSIILLSIAVSFQLTVFSQNELAINESDGVKDEKAEIKLAYYQKSIKKSFKNDHFRKSIKKSSIRLDDGYYDKLAYYYLGLSTYKLYEENLNENLFDQSLIYLSSSDLNNDRLIKQLAQEDEHVLSQIHMLAILFSKRDFKKHRTKAVKRLNYVAEIFLDTVNPYDDFISQVIPVQDDLKTQNQLSLYNDQIDLMIAKKGNNEYAKLASNELIASSTKD